MEITSEKTNEGLACARQTIADLEGIDFDELTDNAAFQKQYGEAVMVIIKMFAILEQARMPGMLN